MAQRAYKPTRLKVLEGNPGKRPLPENEPQPRAVRPKRPKDIDDQARKVWARLTPIIERMGLLTEADGDALAILCQIRARLVAIHEFLKTENKALVQVTEKSVPDGGVIMEMKASPYVIMEKQYYELFRRFAKEFGLTPCGRVGLKVGDKKADEGPNLLT